MLLCFKILSVNFELTLRGCSRGKGEWEDSTVKLWIKTTTSQKFVTTYLCKYFKIGFGIHRRKQTDSKAYSKIQNMAVISVIFRSMLSLSIKSSHTILSVFLLCPMREIISKFSKHRTLFSESFTEYWIF
jgi:hypothetical protein